MQLVSKNALKGGWALLRVTDKGTLEATGSVVYQTADGAAACLPTKATGRYVLVEVVQEFLAQSKFVEVIPS